MTQHLTWRHLKALHQLFTDSRTEAKILDNTYIANVLFIQKRLIRYKSGNQKILETSKPYKQFYQDNFLWEFDLYKGFLQRHSIEDDARRKYTEQDIQTLMFISENKDELINNLTTIRTFSSEIFKGYGSKYLENKPGLKTAVCKVLGIVDFPDKDPKNHQWRLVVDCINPQVIVLCENISHLKMPRKARDLNIELWYVGGNNIAIIDFIAPEKILKPIYYSCDWDYHGLSIYSSIKKKLQEKNIDLKILKPTQMNLAIPVNSPHHFSYWVANLKLSGLNTVDFTAEEQAIIKTLIKADKWIEEESMSLRELIAFNLVKNYY